MKEMILLYQFEEAEKKKILQALLPLRYRLREVKPEEYGLPIGVLAGTLENSETAGECDRLSASMMVLCGLTDTRLNALLAALRRQGLRIPYKAMLTATNQHWTAPALLSELKEEHRQMTEGRQQK